ncbi:MAG: rod shape-determining protein MreC [[Clostridium] fimetarium]|nr:rod shape-determining protein MreC [Alistipes timonensis]MCM1406172.1 rod shape-determining protein MreC [[Clostridium] fimetarium]
MRNLLDFIVRFSSWFVFAFYVIASCWLLFDRNPYQHHVWLTSAGSVAAGVYDVSNNVTGYFSLRSINEDLQRRQADLEAEVASLRTQLRSAREALEQDSLARVDSLAQFRFIVATAISNSVTRPYNYITLDKGEAEGLEPEMGVMDQNGVVGVVNVTGKHHSRVISLLNPNFRLSCKLRGSDAFGSLVWDGKSPREALLEELPKHTRFHKGDTIITSGYSAMFPEGIPVGTIVGSARGEDDNFFTLRIRLLTDFTALSTVKVISNRDMLEIKEVETDETGNRPGLGM